MPAPLVYDPYAYEIHADPYPVYRRLRDEAPAYHHPGLDFWALSRFHDVLAAMQDWQTFSSAAGVSLEEGSGARPPMIIAMDPPRQMQLRRLVLRAFTPRRVATMEPQVRGLARRYLEPLVARGSGDFVGEFAARVPMDVVSEMIGVPAEDRALLRGWVEALLHREEGRSEIPRAGLEGAANLVRYFADDLARRRRAPADDLVSALLAAEVDGERLADDEIVGFCFLLVIAGIETTTNLLGNALVLLARHPEQRALLAANPERIAAGVEEVLRYDNSTQMLARVLTRDLELHGQTMRQGTKVLLLLGSANRDERVFERADEFDVRRPPQDHLAFGIGHHFCLGASLARLEARVALEEALPRLGDYEIDEDALVRIHSANVRGYARVPVRLGPRRR